MTSLFFSIPITLISAVGLILNGYILTIIVLTRQVRTANNILLFHLGTVDILLGIVFLIFSLPALKGAEWPKAGIPCIFHGFLFTLLHPLALWTICGLNCDRYYIIAAPLHYTHIISSRKIIFGLGFGWIISLVLCIPPLFRVAPYKYIPGLEACGPDFTSEAGTLWYSALYTSLTLLLPATVIICCNLRILMIARYHRHRIASAIYEVTLSAQVTITHQRNPFFVPTITASNSGLPRIVRSTSAIYSVFQLVGSFIFLYSPYYMIILWESTVGSANNILMGKRSLQLHPNFYALASVLLISTLPINGFLYGIKSQTLRKSFQNYWRKKQTKIELNQEIQARTPSTCGSRRPSLTPFGFLTKPSIQRRLSETFMDRVSRSPMRGNKMKRIASEITWRKTSSNSLNQSPKEEYATPIKQTSSCSTLQVPTHNQDATTLTEDVIYFKAQQRISSPVKALPASVIHKIFGIDQTQKADKSITTPEDFCKTSKRSPRILITRAYSEESEKSSNPNTPHKEISKIHSTSATTLLDRKWRHLRYKEDMYNDRKRIVCSPPKPFMGNVSLSHRSSISSASDASSDASTFLTTDRSSANEQDNEPTEDQLLLSHNVYKKYGKNEDFRRTRPTLLKQAVVQSHDVVL